mmetsp:Transcript_37769/g.52442  ORF Transcript_37769/g.52442 Transcript_37769/m.52442 type:complete len:506 (+) Transcript_37769:89-1606(+)|eukprot:CAMPEP_0196590724 /NCGR_PEP_ID=MMETSP1081-20130531/67356_1 /TAXON_ID=36882 /ORGANISM="Pyramimonas amylifera, Strain CCMP720" /LENGTH=505 /DNA_ID=CAMNT_0041913901 /DNA_START=80 /DNA_END=1597 /DNA_ORIENTATION=+
MSSMNACAFKPSSYTLTKQHTCLETRACSSTRELRAVRSLANLNPYLSRKHNSCSLTTPKLNSRKQTVSCRAKTQEDVDDEDLTIEADYESLFPPDDRIPVTIITGFLGSGKTTLLNRVLGDNHGLRVAVIENEFGEIDIDGSLVAAQQKGDENIMMLNNGCICCTVRGDLVEMLGELIKTRREDFDHVLIETTGLANPAPVIQTFFLEEELAKAYKIDGVVTVVDSKHISMHLDEKSEVANEKGRVNEAMEQIAFADRIVLNKTDLVDEAELAALQARIKEINSMAVIRRCVNAEVPTDFVMGVGGFDLERVVDEVDSQFLKKEEKHSHAEEHQHEEDHSNCDHDHGKCDHDHSHDHAEAKKHSHESHSHSEDDGHDHSSCDHDHGKCEHDHDHTHHHHDDAVSSVALVQEGLLDLEKVNLWLGLLLQDNSDDIYRMKGVLAIKGAHDRFVFQGVHALFEGSPERPWEEGEEKISRMVFIGKDLPKEEIIMSFKACLADEDKEA